MSCNPQSHFGVGKQARGDKVIEPREPWEGRITKKIFRDLGSETILSDPVKVIVSMHICQTTELITPRVNPRANVDFSQ